MTDETTKRGPGRPATRNKPHEGTERAIKGGKLDGRTKASKQIKQSIEEVRNDPVSAAKAELEKDIAESKLMKELIVGYIANNADILTPDEMYQMIQRLTTLQSNSVRAYTTLIEALEG